MLVPDWGLFGGGGGGAVCSGGNLLKIWRTFNQNKLLFEISEGNIQGRSWKFMERFKCHSGSQIPFKLIKQLYKLYLVNDAKISKKSEFDYIQSVKLKASYQYRIN